jgi:hypothetical protein
MSIYSCQKVICDRGLQKYRREVKIVGTSGSAGVNPTMLMRTGDFAMELTVVVNEDSLPHALYI